MPEADTLSDSSSISRATDIDADWEEIAAEDHHTMMNDVSASVNQLLERANNRLEQLKDTEVYQTFFKDSPFVTTCLAITVGILSLPALSFLSFIFVLCLLSFLGFLFIEGTLITFGLIVAAGILIFVAMFLFSVGCCIYVALYILRALHVVADPRAVADAAKKPE